MADPKSSKGFQPLLFLRGELESEEGLSQALVSSAADVETSLFGSFVAAGPRATEPEAYAVLVEAIREGYLLHYAEPRLFISELDRDLALLAGDFLYALGLERLSGLGDTESVTQLADLISLQGVIHADGTDVDSGLDRLDRSLWLAISVAVACGTDPQLEAMKAEIPASKEPFGLATRLLGWADARVAETGVDEAWAQVREQVGFETEAEPSG